MDYQNDNHDEPTVNWDGPPCRDDLGIDFDTRLLTKTEQRVIFRALNVAALLVEMGAEWVGFEDAEDARRLARVVLPEGIGVDLEAGE